MKFKTQWNADEFPRSPGETNTGISETIPDQSLSVREIMTRHAHGLPVSGERVPVYHGEEEFLPDPNTLDLAEREDLKIQNAEEIKRHREALNDKIQSNKNEKKHVEKNTGNVEDLSSGAADEGDRNKSDNNETKKDAK